MVLFVGIPAISLRQEVLIECCSGLIMSNITVVDGGQYIVGM